MKEEIAKVYGEEKLNDIEKESEILFSVFAETIDATTIATVGSLDYNVRNLICDNLIRDLPKLKASVTPKQSEVEKISVYDLMELKDKGTVFATTVPLKDASGNRVPEGTRVQITHIDAGNKYDMHDPIVHWGSTDDKYFGVNYFYCQYGNPILSKIMNVDDIMGKN